MPLATFSNVRRLGTTLLAVVFALSLLPVQSIFAGSASDTPIDQSAAQTAAAPDGQSAATEAAAPDGQSAATETDTSAGTDGSATATLPATEASAPAADTLADSTAATPEGSSPEGQSATEAATDAATAPATDTGPGATEATDTTAAASTGASQAIEPTGNAVVPIGQEPTTSQTPTTGGTQATGGTEAIDTGLVPVSAVSPASPATPASPASPATGSEPSSAPTYSVTYNANGGFGGAIDSQKYSAGDTVTVSYVAPTKVDVSGTYAFEGWAYTPDATYPAFIQNITPSTFKISQDTTLYAVWGAATPFMGITPADSNPSIHMHGGAGYTFIFYFTVPDTFNRSGLPIGSKMQNIGGVDYYVITLVGTSNTDSIATALDGHEYLAYVDIYRTSDGLLIEHVTEDHIGHVSDDTADLQNDGSMGSDGLVEVNTGVINFWYQYHSPVPNSLDVSIQANKQVTGTTAIPAGLFEFGLFDSNGVQVATATNDSNGNIVFTDPSLHYTDADLGNIYSFTIRELGFDPNAPESITKWWAPEDPSPEYTVTYRVILDNYVLTADFTAPADYPKSIVFTNHYTAHTSAVLEAQKLTDGRALEAEQFYFTIYDQDGVPVQYSTTSNDASGNIVFPEIAYQDINQDSSYTYTIKEDTPLPSGWTSNGDVYQAVVTFVADPESEGGYDTVVTYKYWDGSAWVPFSDPADLPTFTNTYKTTPTSWTPKATKTTDGRDMTDGQFSFALYNSDEEGDQGTLVGTATNSGTGTSGQVTFEDQIYDSPGTFYYLMVETSAGVNGWKTDTAQHLIKVTVTDNGDGTLKATPMLLGDTDWVPYSGPADITFANTYTTTDTSWTPMATKTATGRDMTAGQFAFTIYNSDDQGHQLDAIETATNAPGARNSAVDFTALGYNQPGTSYYLIEETSPGGAGWTADSTSYWVKVDVTDNGLGALVATATYWDGSAWATYSPAAVTFNNTYTTTKTSWTPEATKTTSGRDMADGQFSFALYSSDAAGTQGAEVETGTNTRDGDSSPVTFDPLTYDSPGTNYYLMVETSTDGGGWTVDSASYLFTVTVTDNGLGALTNIVGIAKWDGSAWQPYTDMPTFNNDYQASGSADLTAIKRVSGEPLLDHEFTFGVYEGTTLVSTGTNDENGLVTFEPIDYVLNADQDDTGTHSYTVVETGYSVPGDGHGWAMSEATFNVYVDVADSGHGTLTTNVRYDGGTPTFVNTYEADGSLTLKAAKATEGRTATAGQFSFVVLDEDDNVVATGTNASDGTVTFSSIPFKQDAIDKTFTYTIKELDTGLGGWAYDPNPYSVTVKVGDDLSGGLTFDVDYGTPGNVPPTFNNTYTTTDTSWTPAATKTSTGRSMTAGQFEFTLYNSDDQGAQLDAIETATNADPGTSSAVNFQYLTYDAPGTFYYLVKETSAGGQGWAVSTASYWVRVTVTDNGQGALVATPEYWNGSAWVPYSAAAVSFANTYTTTDTSWTPAATKTSTGRDMTAGQFEFTLYNSDDQGGQLDAIETATNADPGTSSAVDFSQIDFSAPGTSYYLVKETSASGQGWAVSTASYWVRVTVTDNGQGALVATPEYWNGTAWVPYSPAAVSFANAYTTTDTSWTPAATKTSTGRDMTAGQFDFTLYESDDTGAQVAPIETVTNADPGLTSAVNFSQIDYTSPGTSYYLIKETSTGGQGWAVSTASYWVRVIVTDNGLGALVPVATFWNGTSWVAYSAAAVSFANAYTTTPTSWLPMAQKTSTGRDMTAGQFTFTLYESDYLGAQGAEVETATNASDGRNSAVNFDQIDYDTPGTYYYLIKETSTGGQGWAVSTASYWVRVTVTDNGYGALVATPIVWNGTTWITYNATAVSFNNAYTTTPTSWDPTATKTTSGSTMTAGEFDFTLYESDSMGTQGTKVETVQNHDAGMTSAVDFSPITYTAPGTYYYLMVESSPATPGWVEDGASYLFTVTVTDNGLGALTRTVDTAKWDGSAWQSGIDEPTFNNDYSATGSAVLTGTKTAKGEDLVAGEFSFTAYEFYGTPEQTPVATATNAADGTIIFSPIDYALNSGQDDIGTHTYTVVETGYNGIGGGAGWVFSRASFNVNVTVSDNGDGTLDATVAYPSDLKPNFVNTYNAAGDEVLSAAKETSGRPLEEGQFKFYVVADYGQPTANVVATGTNDANGIVQFEPIHFTEADAGQTFTYAIVEADTGTGGWTYDDSVYYVDVTVIDDGDSTLSFAVTYYGTAGDDVPPTFSNYYEAEGSWTPMATKVLENQALTDGEFSFAVKDANGNVVSTGTSDANGAINFTPVDYKLNSTEDDTGAHAYTIVETSTDGNGVAVDGTVYSVTVTVTDNGDGTLTAAPDYGTTDNEPPTFTNVYSAAGSWTPMATKVLENQALTDGEFSFAVKDANGDVVSTGTSDANGAINFTPVEYSFNPPADDTGTHAYTIAETSTDGNGVTVDRSVYDVTVTVTDNGDGTLEVEPDYGTTDNVPPTFTNTYTAEGHWLPMATKVLENQAMTDGEFSFAVYDANGNMVSTGTSDANGAIAFTPVDYYYNSSEDDTGLHYYTIAETSVDGNGITVDPTVFSVTVNVSDELDGNLGVAISYGGIGSDTPVFPVFTNVYSAEGHFAIAGVKSAVHEDPTYTDPIPIFDDEFSFSAYDENGAVVAAGSNAADGAINFSEIDYTLADVGTHHYTVKEDIPDPQPMSWIYDPTEFNVDVTVSDNHDGTLSEDVEWANGLTPAFVNVYHDPQVVEAPLQATKVVEGDGATLTAGEFSFELVDQDGQVIQTQTNAANGLVAFDNINYTMPGTYLYTMHEVIPAPADQVEGYKYDQTEYTVVATVVLDRVTGDLRVSFSTYNSATFADPQDPGSQIAPADVVFTNIYTPQKVFNVTKASLVIPASKVIKGTDQDMTGQFTFGVFDANGKQVAKGTNGADGTIAFSPLTYSAESEEGSYTYTVRETNPGMAGWTMDASVYTVAVNVTETVDATTGDKALVATIESISKADTAAQSIVFTNVYKQTKVVPATTPKTGDSTSGLILVAAILAAGGLLLIERSRRRKTAH